MLLRATFNRHQNNQLMDYKMVDVYAFGMIAYYVWTGGKPWDGLNENEIESKVLQNERPDLEDDKEMTHLLIKRCWDSFPEKRPHFHEIKDSL